MKIIIAVVSLILYSFSSQANNTGYADIVDKVLPSVVSISVIQNIQQPIIVDIPQFPPGSPFEEFFKDFIPNNQGQKSITKPSSIGSGFIVQEDGIVMTNAHVIENAKDLSVIFHDNTKAKASILSIDKKTDIALLKIAGDKKYPTVNFGNSDKSRIGDKILAIGNPFGLGITVTSGIISARARDIQAGPYDDFIQTDAPINRGNSGGPMFNTNGEVIGINTAIFSPSGGSVGIGFAIPSNIAKHIYKNLIEHGKIRRGQIGVKIQTVTQELAENLGLETPTGAMIADITKNGPADKAGIQIGDIILSLNNEPIKNMRHLPKLAANSPIGKKIPIEIWRNNKKENLTIIVEEMLDSPEEIAQNNLDINTTPTNSDDMTIDDIGITIVNINDETRKKYKLSKEEKGVIITDIKPNSEAEAKNLMIGDTIIEIKQTPIVKTSDVAALIQAAKNQNQKSILMLLNTQEGLKFVALRLK